MSGKKSSNINSGSKVIRVAILGDNKLLFYRNVDRDVTKINEVYQDYDFLNDRVHLAQIILSDTSEHMLKSFEYLYNISSEQYDKTPFEDWKLFSTIKCASCTHTYAKRQEYEQFLREFYVDNRKIPTLKDFITTFDIEPPIDRLLDPLRKNGFQWTELPGTGRAIVEENPEQFCQKILYLHKMMSWRKSGRPILYLECINLAQMFRLNSPSYLIAAVSTSKGLIRKEIHKKQPTKAIEEGILLWIELTIKDLDNHLIVIGDHTEGPSDIEAVPNITSKRVIMINWLNSKGIPFNPAEHRAELYKVIKQHSRVRKRIMESVESEMKSNLNKKIEFLNQPRGLTDLAIVYTQLIKKLTILSSDSESCCKKVTECLNQISLSQWKVENIRIQKLEYYILQQDMRVEETIDKLKEFAKHNAKAKTGFDVPADLDEYTIELGRNNYSKIIAD